MEEIGTALIFVAVLFLMRIFTTKEDVQKVVELEGSEILREKRKEGQGV
jgi:lauroyl/myristoyl acyltransferase